MRIISIIFIVFLCVQSAIAQDIVNQIVSNDYSNTGEIFTETIKTIGRSKKIFILTNQNGLLGKGDFITLMIDEQKPVLRALVAKNQEGLTGIKILKIYSLKRWAKLYEELPVQILKGDDSRLFVVQKQVTTSQEEKIVIEDEADLYNDVALIEGNTGFVGKDNRHIKPDNIVGLAWGRLNVEDNITGNLLQNNQYYGHWAYQFADNYWLEGVFGRTLINNFPANSTSTLVINYTARIKYIFKLPLYSYAMPYVGYQVYTVSSPNAGDTADPELALAEAQAVESLAKRNIVAGVTLLRRLVPGWFIKANLGTDAVNIGFSVEF